MRKSRLAAVLFLLAAPLAAQDGPRTPQARRVAGRPPSAPDHAGQFVDPPKRDQSVVGSCHAFAAVALLEAAYFRGHGHRVRLSEEDLFLHGTILSGRAYINPCRLGLNCGPDEGAFVDENINHALAHGVLTGSNYSEFVERYRVQRRRHARLRTALAAQRDGHGAPLDFDFSENPEKSWGELFASPEIRQALVDTLGRGEERAESERAHMKELFSGFALLTRAYDLPKDARKLSAKECAAIGRERLEEAVAELKAGRPVAVAMKLSGLPSWGAKKEEHAYHAFALTGFYPGKDGQLRFRTRNSWAGVNPPVLASQFCRVYQLDTVLASGETPTF